MIMYHQTKFCSKRISNHNTDFGSKMFGGLENIIWINIDILTLRCDLDFACNNPIFSQDALAYDNLSSEYVWLPKNQQFRRYSSQSNNLIICALAVTLTLKAIIHIFHKTLWPMITYHRTKFGCQRISSSEDIVVSVCTFVWPCMLVDY